jgi:hypothetical protein
MYGVQSSQRCVKSRSSRNRLRYRVEKGLPSTNRKFPSVTVGNDKLPRKFVSGSELHNSTVFGSELTTGKAVVVEIPGTESKILIPIRVRPVAQLAPQNGLQSGFDVKGEKALPVMRALMPAERIRKLEPHQRFLLNVNIELRADLFTRALGAAPGGSHEAKR